MRKAKYISIPQMARLLGISRIAVYKRVKKGRIKAIKIGRTYAIPAQNTSKILGETLTDGQRSELEQMIE